MEAGASMPHASPIPRIPRGKLAREPLDELNEVDIEGVTDTPEFDEIKAALSGLLLADE